MTPEKQLSKVAALMVETLKLAATAPDEVRILEAGVSRPRVFRVVVAVAHRDVPLVVGGRGANSNAIRELGVYGCPAGWHVEVGVEAPDQPPLREARVFTRRTTMDPDLRRRLVKVIGDWHELLECDPGEVLVESTRRADVFVVTRDELPGAVMSGIRRVLGWACRIHGRHGFIEWERETARS